MTLLDAPVAHAEPTISAEHAGLEAAVDRLNAGLSGSIGFVETVHGVALVVRARIAASDGCSEIVGAGGFLARLEQPVSAPVPWTPLHRKFCRDMAAFIEYARRNGLLFASVLRALCHDLSVALSGEIPARPRVAGYAELSASMDAMGNDEDILRESAAISRDFEHTTMDGLEHL